MSICDDSQRADVQSFEVVCTKWLVLSIDFLAIPPVEL